MTHPPMVSPMPPPAPPPKPRPSAWWFSLGGALLVLAAACLTVFIVLLVRVLHTDGILPADAARHTVYLSGTGRYELSGRPGDPLPQCRVFDGGIALPLSPFDNTTTSIGSETWVSFAIFTTDAPEVQVVCVADAQIDVRVGTAFEGPEFAALALSASGAGGFGLLGFAALLTVAILYISRPKRGVSGW